MRRVSDADSNDESEHSSWMHANQSPEDSGGTSETESPGRYVKIRTNRDSVRSDDLDTNVSQLSPLSHIRQQMAEMQESHRKRIEEMETMIKSTMMPRTDSEFSGEVAGASTEIRLPSERMRGSVHDEARDLGMTLSSMLNPVSLAWSQVGQCTAANGEDIQITDYECWKKRFEIQMKISNITCPTERQKYFDLWAGHKLSLILETAPDVTNTGEEGYDVTVLKLNQVFRGRSSDFSLQQDLRTAKQKANETNVAYLSRLMTLALRVWDRTSTRIHEEILHAVTQNSSSKELQRFAYAPKENSQSGKSYEDLVGQARILDTIAANVDPNAGELFNVQQERHFIEQRGSNSGASSNFNATQRNLFTRENQDGWRPNQMHSRNLGQPKARESCNRCGSWYHDSLSCFHKDKRCYNCGSIGHLKAMCNRSLKRVEPGRQSSSGAKRNYSSMSGNSERNNSGSKIRKTEGINEVVVGSDENKAPRLMEEKVGKGY